MYLTPPKMQHLPSLDPPDTNRPTTQYIAMMWNKSSYGSIYYGTACQETDTISATRTDRRFWASEDVWSLEQQTWGQNESTLHLLGALSSLSHLVCLPAASASQSLICMDRIKRLVWVWLPPASKTPVSPSFTINLCMMIVVVCPRFQCMQTLWTIRVFINCEHEAYHHLLSPIAVHISHS